MNFAAPQAQIDVAPFNDDVEEKSYNSIEEIKDDPDPLMPSEANI